ncbi:MAG: hypothetical protein ACFE9R_02970 [Candidatus Hermodarchaeota archaeon]
MKDRDFDNFSHYFDKWSKDLINFGVQRDLLDKQFETMVNNLLNIESQIYKSLIDARSFFDEKRQFYAKKVRLLKYTLSEYHKFLEYFTAEVKHLPEPTKPKEIINSIERTMVSIKKIDKKIDSLKNKLIEETLNIDQENTVLEDLNVFETQKQMKIDNVIELEQALKNELESNIFFRTQRSIEILQVNLIQIKKSLEKWTKKRTNCHKKMLNLYRKAKEFENVTMQMENELYNNRDSAYKNYQIFNDLITQNRNKILKELSIYLRKKKKPEKVKPKQKPIDKELIKRKKTRKKFVKKKLTQALDKKKAGKKLDFYELKLILDHSKK